MKVEWVEESYQEVHITQHFKTHNMDFQKW